MPHNSLHMNKITILPLAIIGCLQAMLQSICYVVWYQWCWYYWYQHVSCCSMFKCDICPFVCYFKYHKCSAVVVVVLYVKPLKNKTTQIVKSMGPTWGPPGSCRAQMGPMLAPWTLLSGDMSVVAFVSCYYCCCSLGAFQHQGYTHVSWNFAWNRFFHFSVPYL